MINFNTWLVDDLSTSTLIFFSYGKKKNSVHLHLTALELFLSVVKVSTAGARKNVLVCSDCGSTE